MSVGEGSRQLNYGKVYSGLCEFEGRSIVHSSKSTSVTPITPRSPGTKNQGRPRVQITPSDLPESPRGKDPKDLNLLISVFGSQSPTAPGLANQFTRVIRHSLFRHQHCINGISGTADHRAHHRRSLPLFAVCHHSCALAARRRFHLHSSSSLGA